ncbi:MAG: hypothetical protein HOH86_11605 [Verrucomicrobiales bacterium]|nr:hypothetical protein [Verrucomicrobiales bacterium]
MLNSRAAEFFGNIFGALINAGEFNRAHKAIAHATMLALNNGGEHTVVAAIHNPMLGPKPREVKSDRSASKSEGETQLGGGVPEPI